MTERERLIELIKQKSCLYNECEKSCSMCDCVELYDSSIEKLVDYLLENGVTVPKPKFIRPPADLTGKCGSCKYSKPYEGESRTFKSYVECTNKEHLKRYGYHKNTKYRQRTAHACKKYSERSVAK